MLTFDMIVMMKLPYVPGVAEWLIKVRKAVYIVLCEEGVLFMTNLQLRRGGGTGGETG